MDGIQQNVKWGSGASKPNATDSSVQEVSWGGPKLDAWYLYVKEAVTAYNATPQCGLGNISPFEVLHGAKFSNTAAEFEKIPVAHETWAKIRENIVKAQEGYKRAYKPNRKTSGFSVGDPEFVRDTSQMGQRKLKIDSPNVLKGVIVGLGRRSAVVEMCATGAERKFPTSMLQKRVVPDGE